MQHKEFLQWPVLLTVWLQENNQPLKINVRAGSNKEKKKKLDGWLRGDGEGAKKMAEQIQKMAERRGGTLGAERGKKQDGELNQLGRGNRKVKKKGEIQAQVQIF